MREISRQFGLAVEPTALVAEITVGQQQRVEILKALYRGAEILILDEPTAVLTPQEATELFAIVKSLQADGKSIIFISHKLNEVLEIGDRTTVLRRGKKIETVPCAGATAGVARAAMVGREVLLRVEKPPAHPGRGAARGRGPPRPRRPRDREGARASRSRSARARSSASPGVDGNGQTELIDAITGLRQLAVRRGQGRRAGRCSGTSARGMLDAGVGHIPEDRAAARARARVLDRREHRAARLRRSRRTRGGAGSSRSASSSGRAR